MTKVLAVGFGGFLGALARYGVGLLAAALLALASPAARAQDLVVAAAGDIACDPGDPSYNGGDGTATACRMKATSDLLVGAGLTAVFLLGDDQYWDGSLAKFLVSYEPTWGRVKAITRPAPGNHDYGTAGAAGYFAYFGAAAGEPGKGWYSFDLASWHVVVLNSNCASVGGCGPGSAQETWLKGDLAANDSPCTLALWHHPRFSSGFHGDDATFDAFWRALYASGADLVLNGHDHDYERFAPQDPDGLPDPAGGIRELVVGTGGFDLRPFPLARPNSEVRDATSFGVLRLTLKPAGYEWRFVAAPPGTLADAGFGTCHRAPPARFHALAPCRLADTRRADGPDGGPALPAGASREFPVGGACGIPTSARAVALNLTAVDATEPGHLRLGPAGTPPPSTSVLNFPAGRTRANNAVAHLGTGGRLSVTNGMPQGTVHVVLDASGWFE